jgi:OmpA-OmpF porin, OOP family
MTSLRLTLISLATSLVMLSQPALAQSNDWNTFPATQPSPQPANSAAPPPAQTPVFPTKPVAKNNAPTAPDAKKDNSPSADGTTVISQKERVVPGTESHSPSTFGNDVVNKQNARVTVGQVGIGTLQVPSARLGMKGVVRVSLLGEYLNINDFPVKSASDIRSGVTFAASFQPFEWGEIFVSYGAAANSNSRTSPNLIQALGDLTLGVKLSNEWAKGLHAGIDLRLLTFSGVGNQGFDRFAFGFKPTALLTYDFRSINESIPVLVTVAPGITIDSTSGLVTNQKLNASEEYALSVNRFNRFNLGLAVEVPLPFVTPFIEYNLSAPLGVPSGQLTGPDGSTVPVSAAMPQQLGLGLKITAIKDLTLTTGVNLGLTRSVGLGVPATPPWNFFVGAAFAIDPFQRGETKITETIRERKVEVVKTIAPQTLRVAGRVVSTATGQVVPNAIVTPMGGKPVATDAAGEFLTQEVTGTVAKLTVFKEGFKTTEKDVPLDPKIGGGSVEIAIEEDIKKAKLDVTAMSNKKPVKAVIALTGASPATLTTSEVSGTASAEVVAGPYGITATADGFLSQTRDVQVAPGVSMPVNFELVALPKKSLVIFRGDKIDILQQVHFASGKSTILADSFGLLQQVVDVIVRNNVKRIRVDGHTDNKGVKTANQTLSEDRARAVADYLIAQGVDAKRVESVGYGDSKPIAPNLTARGRELNRRVEFIVLEK